MHLFTQLLNLHSQNKPVENFFTEIVAYLFDKNREILIEWLKSISLIINENEEIIIGTQMYFDPVQSHYPGSKPDITIVIKYGDYKDIIFIESKIGSKEGENQLAKYAEALMALKEVRNRYLVYITRDYEPKVQSNKFAKSICFYQLRWYTFYQFLQSFKAIAFVQEVIDFMKGNNMALNNQFSTIDILSMTNFQRALSLMESTMNDEAMQRMTKLFGSTCTCSITQFSQQGRFILQHPFFKNRDFWCGIGYFDMDSENYTDYPSIGCIFEVSNRKYSERDDIIKAMEKFIIDKTEWEPYNLHNLNSWAGIYIAKSLNEILSAEDHIKSIKKHFQSFLDDAELFKQAFPDLPWGNPPADSEV